MTVQPELALIAAAAIVPPAIAAAIVHRLAADTDRVRLGALVAFLWGAAVASVVASIANDGAGALASIFVGAEAARRCMPIVVAPAIEELAKAMGFVAVAVVARDALGSTRGAIAMGAAIGLGFAAVENVGYYTLAAVQGGAAGLGRAVYLRGLVESANHAVFTALAGAGIGWARARSDAPRVAIVVFAVGLAIAAHALWNGVVSGAITTVLCNAPAPDAACAPAPDTNDLLLVVPALEAAFLVPALVVLAWLARRG